MSFFEPSPISPFNNTNFKENDKFLIQADPNKFYFYLKGKRIFRYGEGGSVFKRIVYFRNVVFLQHLLRLEDNLKNRIRKSNKIQNDIILAMKARRQINALDRLIREQSEWLAVKPKQSTETYKKLMSHYVTEKKIKKFDSFMSGYCARLHKKLKKSNILPVVEV